MRASPIFPAATALALAAALSACAGPKGSFPSLAPRPAEAERLIEAPGAEITPALLPEQQASLRADLQRESAALAAAESELAALGGALDRELAAARGKGVGTEGWSNAQMALSRYDQARAPLDGIGVRLVPLARMVDSLPETDADRQAVLALTARTEALSARSRDRVAAANRALGL
ncbi:hypothetical protein FJQ54_01340 [Sandaracinobacter neustonicus]|uniref:Lipoprotein n=1 Tax=Sandaracinobacter neustonicus TaxID=1715348 RepID=A0A501XV50_9SPHN|nr:hypothetical protein [Sandaracinobacter neustonicus]TPE64450.1 hypothetical protein FJQ54_01340 [Sandaracinobacter neustonicus]